MELKETIEMMTSPDYKERFRAEYYQLKIRYDKLVAMCESWDKGTLPFTPTCPRDCYELQLQSMKGYLSTLVIRARLEDVVL